MKRTFLILMTGSLFFLACKKNENEKTTQEKLSGKWSIISTYENEHINGISDIDTTYFTSTGTPTSTKNYFDFRADGKLYSDLDGKTDTTIYSVKSNNTVQLDTADPDVMEIKVLTDNTLALYFKRSLDNNNYTEQTINCKK